MGRRWIQEMIEESLEEAKKEGNEKEIAEIEQLLKKRKERGL